MPYEYNPITEEQPCEAQFRAFWRKNEMFYRAILEGFFDLQYSVAGQMKVVIVSACCHCEATECGRGNLKRSKIEIASLLALLAMTTAQITRGRALLLICATKKAESIMLSALLSGIVSCCCPCSLFSALTPQSQLFVHHYYFLFHHFHSRKTRRQ